MNKQNYTTSITVNANPEEVFENINNVADWWTKNVEGSSQRLNDVFIVRFGETFITLRVDELIANKKISWHVIDCYKHWLKDKKEWMDTVIHWEINADENGTLINFSHMGLVPGIECYNGCEKAWNFYVKESLFKLLSEGKGVPELQ